MLRPRRLRRQLDRELQSLPSLKFALRFGGSLLELALYFSRTLTDIHGLAHCNERGRTRADAGRADNGDNLRWRNVDRGAMWSGERHEKIQDYRQNIGHVLLPLALNVGQLLRRVPIGLALPGTQRVLPFTLDISRGRQFGPRRHESDSAQHEDHLKHEQQEVHDRSPVSTG